MSKKSKDVNPGKFWSTQPVLQAKEAADKERDGEGHAIDPMKDPAKDVRQEPYALPPGFEWHTANIMDDTEVPFKQPFSPSLLSVPFPFPLFRMLLLA